MIKLSIFLYIVEFLFSSHTPDGKCEIIFRDIKTSQIGIVEVGDSCKDYNKGQWIQINKDSINWFK